MDKKIKKQARNKKSSSLLTQSNVFNLSKTEKKNKLKSLRLSSSYSKDDLAVFFDNRINNYFIDVETLGKICGVTPKTIHNWVYLRSIPYIKLGRKVMFRSKSLISWLNQKEIKP